jgi:serine phosphatase RsbU (regulator of sigma subunit)/DNA-binding response OmpR family regulator
MEKACSLLLVGLDPAELSLCSDHFSRSGHGVAAALNVDEAVEKLNLGGIDLVYLRSRDGGGAAAMIARLEGSAPSLPVVLVCDGADEGSILDIWRAGAADILSLPLTPEALDASLCRCARRLSPRAGPPFSLPKGRFFYLDETGEERWVSVTPPRFTIGRSSRNHLVLDHGSISRSHAEVVTQGDGYLLRDLDSKLGTCVNGARIKEAVLANGDEVQFGGAQGLSFTFHTADILGSLLGGSDPGRVAGMSMSSFRDIGKLFAAFRTLSSIAVLDDLLALVVDTAIELTGAERGFIMLREMDGSLQFRCARSRHKHSLDGSCFQTSRRIPEEVRRTGRPIFIKDLDHGTGAEWHESTRQIGLLSISCVPLRYVPLHDEANPSGSRCAEIIGVLYLDSANVGARLTSTRVEALETLAMEAAMAIYNAKLYKDLEDKRRMEEQLARAREIQQALLPPPVRDRGFVLACGWSLPCYEIGGDYFDYFDLDGDCFGFTLGDVAGKGISAALLASLVQGLFSAQGHFDSPLESIVSSINRNLALRGDGSRFVTSFFGVLCPDGSCRYVNAGHNPPILLRRDGSLEQLTAGGTVLGLFAGVQYRSACAQFGPGDRLVLFTDGAVEALGASGTEFGLDRLISVLHSHARLPAPEMLALTQAAVLDYSEGVPQADDITLLVLEFRGRSDGEEAGAARKR